MGIDGIENLFGDDFPLVAESTDHDATDVNMVAVTHTGDGSGFLALGGEDKLPPSDFDEEDEDQ